ncbi:penicillin-binding protein activator [Thalassotalea mangrovi]|uniref:Penicillin-binding protein activator n=1 Tax=Thalassotalea mangrovi TaxID=2572245 RepID=A0A4V5NUV5_9GAMM|nr:penicillin-binding protein activator [Thalassotalea mangrovi]TKB47918.1 hypothetical protein E8M12_00475 [Thalassotalea mangrovi]
MNVKFLLSVSIVILFLYGCATPETKKPAPATPVTQQPIDDEELQPASVEELLEQARGENSEETIVLLLQAGQKLLGQQQPQKSLFLSQQLANLPLNQQQLNYNRLNMAEAALQLKEPQLSQALLAQIDSEQPGKRQLRLQADALLAEGKVPEAISAYLHLYDAYPASDLTQLQALENLIGQLMPWQLNYLQNSHAPALSPWLALAELQTDISDNGRYQKALISWQRQYPAHMAQPLVEDKIAQLASTDAQQRPIERIAVIIPLSGREASLGEAIQHGMLAAYQHNQDSRPLTFIDSNARPMTDIVQELMMTPPDFVVGPLLKQNVDAYIATEQQLMPHTWPSLLLNLPEQQQPGSQHFVFSMRPEDEAKQAAFTLFQQGYQQPVILSQDSSLGKRLADTFEHQWRQQSGNTPQVIYYHTSKEMEQAVKTALDVNLSKERIFLMRNRMNENLKAEPRNRRDIDMIYIFASADDARLLKPYVDVNISPFAKAIPIFASSRSHNINRDNNTSRDLNGLTFTEMPWLLPNQARQAELWQQARQLWPNTSSGMQRLYAMGIDTMNLVDKAEKMQRTPAMHHAGETGTLQMDSERIISRSLSWGKYGFRRVSAISMP